MQVEKPNRVSWSYTQHLEAPPETVFPLLCPIREMEWVNDWKPKKVLSISGVAETDCVFITPGIPEDALWLMNVHDAENHRLEIIKFIPGVVVGKIKVTLNAAAEAGSTADINYTYTALSDHGNRALEEFTREHFEGFMKAWEEELNHFLRTGEKLMPPDADPAG